MCIEKYLGIPYTMHDIYISNSLMFSSFNFRMECGCWQKHLKHVNNIHTYYFSCIYEWCFKTQIKKVMIFLNDGFAHFLIPKVKFPWPWPVFKTLNYIIHVHDRSPCRECITSQSTRKNKLQLNYQKKRSYTFYSST